MGRSYICGECKRTFRRPKTVRDYSSMDFDIRVCPYCGSEFYRVDDEDYKEKGKNMDL